MRSKEETKFYEYIRSQIKDYLPAEYRNVELKEILGRITLVVNDKMVDLEGYYKCLGEYSKEFEIRFVGIDVVEEDFGDRAYYPGGFDFYDLSEAQGDPYRNIILPEIANRLQDSKFQEIQKRFTDYGIIKENIVIEELPKFSYVDVHRYPYQKVGMGRAAVYGIHNHQELYPEYSKYFHNYRIDVTNEMLDAYGITQEDLHQIAVQNTQRFYPPILRGLAELTEGGLPEEMECIYILTNGHIGETALLNENFMDRITARLGDVYVIKDFSKQSVYSRAILIPTDKTQNWFGSATIEGCSQFAYELHYLREVLPSVMNRLEHSEDLSTEKATQLREFVDIMQHGHLQYVGASDILRAYGYIYKRKEYLQEMQLQKKLHKRS